MFRYMQCTTIQYPAFIVKPEADPGEGMGAKSCKKNRARKDSRQMSSLRFDVWWPSSTHYVAPKSSAWVHLQKIRQIQQFSINKGQQSLLSVCFHGKFCTVLEVKCCHKWWKRVKLEWNLTTVFIMNCVGLQGLCHVSSFSWGLWNIAQY